MLSSRLLVRLYLRIVRVCIYRYPITVHQLYFLLSLYKKRHSSRRRKLAITFRLSLLALQRILRYCFRIFRYSSRVAVHIHRASIATRPAGFSAMLRYRFTDAVLYVATGR